MLGAMVRTECEPAKAEVFPAVASLISGSSKETGFAPIHRASVFFLGLLDGIRIFR